ncbi:MAG: hypothetical protein Q7S95_02175 [bacterium]|nr:hypothetical protein [bacterium]
MVACNTRRRPTLDELLEGKAMQLVLRSAGLSEDAFREMLAETAERFYGDAASDDERTAEESDDPQ